MKVQAIIVSSLFLLSACGGGDDSSSTPGVYIPAANIESVSLYAQDVVAQTKVSDTKQISLNNKVVLSSSDDDFVITDIEPVSEAAKSSCQLSLNGDKKSVSVTSDEVADCIYKYTVEAKSGNSGRSDAYLRVGVGRTYANSDLPAISKSLSLTTGSQTINIKNELAAAGETGLEDYRLNSKLVVIGDGHAEVDDKQAMTLSYFSAGEEPYVTIYYSLQSISSGGDIKLGALVLSVSDSSAGTQLAANDFTHIYYDQDGKYELIDVNQLVRINVADRVISSYPDEDIQLVSVLVSNATAFSIFDSTVSTDPTPYIESGEDELSNKTLLFQAATPGRYDVVYTVTDHYGNYDNGIIRINVYNKDDIFSVQGWSTIDMPTCDIPSEQMIAKYDSIKNRWYSFSVLPSSNLKAEDYCQVYYGSSYVKNEKVALTKFTPPLSGTVADYLNVGYQSKEYNDSVQEEVVVSTYDEAVNYCSSVNGRLPTRSELLQLNLLLSLNSKPSGDVTDYDWPEADADHSTYYWTMDKKGEDIAYAKQLARTPTTSLIGTNDLATTATTELRYTSCVLYTEQTSEWAAVKPYSINSEVTPDEKVGIKYRIDSTVTDPHGVVAPYQNVTYTAQDNGGHFYDNNAQTDVYSVDNLSDVNGKVIEYYYDDTYEKNVIFVRLGLDDREILTIDPGLNPLQGINWSGFHQSSNRCYDEDQNPANGSPLYCWKRLAYEDAERGQDPVDVHGPSYSLHDPARVVEEGLPLWLDPRRTNGPSGDFIGNGSIILRIVNQYTRPYTGEDFMMRIKIVQDEEIEPTTGRVVFSLHQPNGTSNPDVHTGNDLYSDAYRGDVTNGGTKSGYYYGNSSGNNAEDKFTPGVLCESPGKHLTFVYDYLTETLVVRTNCAWKAPASDTYSLKGLRQQYAYMWLRYENGDSSDGDKVKNGSLKVYVSSNSVRPYEPLLNIDTFGWDRAGMRIGERNSSWTDSVTGITYSDYPYYILVSVRSVVDAYNDRSTTSYLEDFNILTWDHEDVVE